MEIVIITGPPYSGKGTQCRLLKEQLGYIHISTGDRCRWEKETRTEVGKLMSAYEEKGDLVPDAIMKEIFDKIIEENKDKKGAILDGYPRTRPQVDDLIDMVKAKGLKIKKVVNIEVPTEELLIRANKRAANSDRKDDKDPRIHLKRIEVFEATTRPAIKYMESILDVITLDGLDTIHNKTQRIIACL